MSRLKHLVFVTQVVDPVDPTLGFVHGWIAALASRVDRMTVIGNEVREPLRLPANVDVISLGKEREASRLARGIAYERAVTQSVSGVGTVLFAHMCPVYLNLAAPIAKTRRIPTILWFAHPADSNALWLADRSADAVLTSLPGAYPRPGPKVHIVGQAIDTDAIAFDDRAREDGAPLRLVAMGRTSPAKGFDRIMRAVARAREEGTNVELRVIGPATTPAELAHAAELGRLIEGLRSNGAIRLEPNVAPTEVPAVLAGADALVNAMVAGSGDKVVFESMAVGRLPLVSNPAFVEVLGGLPLELRFERDDERMLASRIETLARADPVVVDETRRMLRARVERDHSLAGWADRVLAVAEGLR
jgi:glycosyltransferase involved in cell wall biosynthesis